MPDLLIAADGSDFTLRAVDYVLRRAAEARSGCRVHLLNVQVPLAGVNVKLFISPESVESYYREEGQKALAAARERLLAGGTDPVLHIGVGDAAATILDFARSTGVGEIVMGTHGRGFLADVVLGSVALGVVRSATLPVVLVR
jgi:nucleotide-binding universal stress UspA family protein